MFSTGSPIIAMQIHRCRGGETPQTRTAQLCSGDAAVVFCGDNSPGLIYNAVPFPQTCQAGKEGPEMFGALVSKAKLHEHIEEEVSHIGEHPELYYFNVHSLSSYAQWYPHSRGMVRGPLQLA